MIGLFDLSALPFLISSISSFPFTILDWPVQYDSLIFTNQVKKFSSFERFDWNFQIWLSQLPDSVWWFFFILSNTFGSIYLRSCTYLNHPHWNIFQELSSVWEIRLAGLIWLSHLLESGWEIVFVLGDSIGYIYPKSFTPFKRSYWLIFWTNFQFWKYMSKSREISPIWENQLKQTDLHQKLVFIQYFTLKIYFYNSYDPDILIYLGFIG